MIKQKTVIVAENVCDLPPNICEQYGVEMVYFLVETDTGVFTDTDEITSENLLEYLENGGRKALSREPSAESYFKVFDRCLKKYDEVVHIAISEKITNNEGKINSALERLGSAAQRVRVFDSGSLSTGIGHMVIRAAKMAAQGASADEIIAMLNDLKDRVVTSFIVDKTDYMLNKGLISVKMNKICSKLSLHPVLILKDGVVSVKSFKSGRYDKACQKYIKSILKKSSEIDKSLAFITHAGCSDEKIAQIKGEVNKLCSFDWLMVTNASAAISSNCGPGTFGVLFVENSPKAK